LPFSIDFDRRPYNTLALPCECVINMILQSIQMGMSHFQMLYSSTLTGRHHPCVKDCFQDVLSDIVGDKVKVQRVLAVKKNTFNQRHYVTCRVVLGTNDRNVYHLQKKILNIYTKQIQSHLELLYMFTVRITSFMLYVRYTSLRGRSHVTCVYVSHTCTNC